MVLATQSVGAAAASAARRGAPFQPASAPLHPHLRKVRCGEKMQHEMLHQGFSISWQEPSLSTGSFSVSIAGITDNAVATLEVENGHKGTLLMAGENRDDAIAKAKAYIDELLRPYAQAHTCFFLTSDLFEGTRHKAGKRLPF